MADNLDENFLIEKDFFKTEKLSSDDEELSEAEITSKGSQNNASIKKRKTDSVNAEANSNSLKKRRRKKNITEILKLRENSIMKPSLPNSEFRDILIKHMNEKFSTIEKNDLGPYIDDLKRRLLKRNKAHKLSAENQFVKKFSNKLEKYLENKEKSTKKCEPFIIVLCSSAIRCIQFQKLLSASLEVIKAKKLFWIHAFAKHKKLSEQITLLQSIKNPTHLVFSTPHRFMQLIENEPKGLLLDQLKYVFIDYTHKDVKQKNFFDKPEIKSDFLKLFFNYLIKINKLKFYLA